MLAHQSRARRAFINNLETERRVHVEEAIYKQRELEKNGENAKDRQRNKPKYPE